MYDRHVPKTLAAIDLRVVDAPKTSIESPGKLILADKSSNHSGYGRASPSGRYGVKSAALVRTFPLQFSIWPTITIPAVEVIAHF